MDVSFELISMLDEPNRLVMIIFQAVHPMPRHRQHDGSQLRDVATERDERKRDFLGIGAEPFSQGFDMTALRLRKRLPQAVFVDCLFQLRFGMIVIKHTRLAPLAPLAVSVRWPSIIS